MLRLLGFVLVVLICISIAPWVLLVGGILCVGWISVTHVRLSTRQKQCSPEERMSATDVGRRPLSTIPLVNAVYCVNCDCISNSPHDECSVCGSHSVIAVSRMWQINLAEAPIKASRYQVSFSAEVCGIPAHGLHESTKLISRLVELGGEVKALHIQVDPVAIKDRVKSDAKMEILTLRERSETSASQRVRRQAS
jgi:hypothetical protein